LAIIVPQIHWQNRGADRTAPRLKVGQLRALAVTTLKCPSLLTDAPTKCSTR